MTKNGETSVDLGIITKQFHSHIAIADTLYHIRKYVLSGDIYGTGATLLRASCASCTDHGTM